MRKKKRQSEAVMPFAAGAKATPASLCALAAALGERSLGPSWQTIGTFQVGWNRKLERAIWRASIAGSSLLRLAYPGDRQRVGSTSSTMLPSLPERT